MTYQVIYSSQAAAPMSLADLEQILVDARTGNDRRGVTGALLYVDGVFLQILEGDRDTVLGLVGSIARDSRHTALHVFHEAEVEQALFSSWRMAYLNPTPGQMAAWLGLEGTATVGQMLADLHRAPARAAQVANGILKALAD